MTASNLSLSYSKNCVSLTARSEQYTKDKLFRDVTMECIEVLKLARLNLVYSYTSR